MNVLININDEIYRHAKNGSEDSNDEWNTMRAIANGTPIPNDATNEDVINAMFPNDDAIKVMKIRMKSDWLNAPYQKGDNE